MPGKFLDFLIFSQLDISKYDPKNVTFSMAIFKIICQTALELPPDNTSVSRSYTVDRKKPVLAEW